jgi:DNA-binding CsgD family transcriptional regulator
MGAARAIAIGGELAELAASDVPVAQFRNTSLEILERAIGADFGITWRLDGRAEGAMVRGFSWSFWERYRQELPRYENELAPLMAAATQRGGAVIDRDVFSLSDRARMGFYCDIIRPIGSRTFVTGLMMLRGRPIGAVQLGRAGSSIDQRAVQVMRRAVPILALGEALRDHDRPRIDPGLTRREREIVDYAKLGFTAAEIATACGTSVNTVRNQLARLYRKLGVANRAELVALLVERC